MMHISTFKQGLAAGFARHKLVLGVFALISVVTLLICFVPVISNDDWEVIRSFAFGEMHWVNWADRRPLLLTDYKLIFSVFGLNIYVLYAINILTLFLNSFLVYWIIQDLLLDHHYLAFAAGLVYMFYPADYTRMWLMEVSTHLLWLLTLVSMILLIDFARKGHWPSLWISLVLFTIMLGNYEAQLGMMSAWCFLLVAMFWRTSWKRRLAILSPLLIAILFVIWRIKIQPAMHIFDPYFNEFTLSPTLLVARVIQGFKVLFLSWTVPFLQFLKISHHRTRILLLLLGLAVILFALAAYGLTTFKSRNAFTHITKKLKEKEIKQDLFLFLVGSGFVVAGYLPIISLYDPNLDGFQTRVNIFAIPGAVLMIVSILNLGALFLAKDVQQLRAIVPAAAIPLLLVGMATQMLVQNASRKTWDEQKELWTQLIEIAPNFVDHTTVVFVLPGYTQLGFAENPPFVSPWEVNSGLKVLYNNPTLIGAYFYPDFTWRRTQLLENGIILHNESNLTVTPYHKAVFVQYNPQTHRLELVQQLQEDFNLPFKTPDYAPDNNITGAKLDISEYRYLLGSKAPSN